MTPLHRGRPVVIERRVGSRWTMLGRTRLSTRSTHTLAKRLAPGHYELGARTPADRDHWAARAPCDRISVR